MWSSSRVCNYNLHSTFNINSSVCSYQNHQYIQRFGVALFISLIRGGIIIYLLFQPFRRSIRFDYFFLFRFLYPIGYECHARYVRVYRIQYVYYLLYLLRSSSVLVLIVYLRGSFVATELVRLSGIGGSAQTLLAAGCRRDERTGIYVCEEQHTLDTTGTTYTFYRKTF